MEINERGQPTAEHWRHVPDDEAVPGHGAVTVSPARWRGEREALAAREAPVGLRIGPADSVDELIPELSRIDLVEIEFPVFTEGRGYSQARLLRQRLGYRGRLRATGDVSRDRLAFMRRCGFDSFQLRAGEDPGAAGAAFDEISVRFQPAVADDDFAARRRRWRGVGAND